MIGDPSRGQGAEVEVNADGAAKVAKVRVVLQSWHEPA